MLTPRRERHSRFSLTTRPLIYGGNRLRLLKNGDQFFPMLLAAINSATRSIHFETYIFEDDNIGQRVGDALAIAADRGVAVHLLLDGFGSQATAPGLIERLRPLGVQVQVFNPVRWQLQRRLLRRLHRKIVLIDDELAFVGGLNIIDDYHHPDPEPGQLGPRFDFAVMCQGPIVAPIAYAVKRLWWTVVRLRQLRRPAAALEIVQPAPLRDDMRAALLLRDNVRHRRTIERAYLEAFDSARQDILIANAYFLPGRRFREALRALAQRGVRVRLLLQGRVEYRLQHYAQQALYGQLLAAGVQIHEYVPSYLHAKVAVVDSHWATVGSSNIDPFSLLLAREANVAVHDPGFVSQLRSQLEQAIAADSVPIDAATFARRGWLRRGLNWIAFGVVRAMTAVATRRAEA
jgi:cardiolipin synthase